MKDEIICPRCDFEFEITSCENGECPNCKNDYYYDEQYSPESGDCWDSYIFEFFSNNIKNPFY